MLDLACADFDAWGGIMTKPKITSPFPKRFTDRDWGRYVRQGKELVQEETRIQFRLGDLTLKMVPSRGSGGNQGVFAVMDRYADAIGINVHTLLEYRSIALRWPPEKRNPDVSWAIHRSLEALDNRFELIYEPPEGIPYWTEDAALRQAGRLPHRPLTKDEKLDRVRVLLEQDEYAAEAVGSILQNRSNVAHQVMADPATQRAVYRAHHEQRRQAAEAAHAAAHEHEHDDSDDIARQVRRRESAVDYTRASHEVLELIGIGTTYLVELQRLIPYMHVSEFTEQEVRAILDNHRRIRVALDWADSAVTTGDTSMDEALERLLSQGDD
ncbi:DUF6192 family protein [Saccharopolyspora sp. WRP15-2]|uniref:DUF6192 family protein n=1 Tax=Saccharopolyspora oryzae TaxID=2997343 RepID=A0ABT4UV91_9PSEU|nr:DUF6192 family protein [Saccharopolyspora oryzae]MDA3625126.1 DUF6192 family protein [Saccharopolyspora oryzae]